MIAGNDNVGLDATPENEPGNQMAGFDMRWNSPIGNLPYAIYAQYIGEDESSYLPAKYLAQLGARDLEAAGRRRPAAGVRRIRHPPPVPANSGSGPYYNCAYNQGRFNVEGYRYKGRVDRSHHRSRCRELCARRHIRRRRTARCGRRPRARRGSTAMTFDARNTVALGADDYAALEFGWRGQLFGETLSVELGVEAIEPEDGERDVEPFGFIGWRHEFRP